MPLILSCTQGDINFQNQTVYIRNGEFTSCNFTSPTWKFKFKELKVENNTLTAKHVIFYIKNIPVFYFPVFKKKLPKKEDMKKKKSNQFPIKVEYYDKDIKISYIYKKNYKRFSSTSILSVAPRHRDLIFHQNFNYYFYLNFGTNLGYNFIKGNFYKNLYVQKSFKELGLSIVYDFNRFYYYASLNTKIYEKEDKNKNIKHKVYSITTLDLKEKKLTSFTLYYVYQNICSRTTYYINPFTLDFGIGFEIRF